MATISDIKLSIFEHSGSANAQLSYTISPSNFDVDQSYVEHVELIGVDEGPHEDGHNEVLAVLPDGIVKFDSSLGGVSRGPEFHLPSAVLDEDSGIFRADEIKARVTLTPLPRTVSRDSNLVVRRVPVFESQPA